MRRKLIPLAVSPLLMVGTHMHAQGTTTLAALRDQKRILLIFAGAHDPRVEEQWAALVAHRQHAAERDLTTILLTQSLIKKHDANGVPYANLSHAEEQAARARFHVNADQFTVLLIGKDGGEKLRSNKPIPWQTLQDTIDAMLMRQAEMRHIR